MCGTWYRRATLLRWSSGSGVVVRGVEGEMVVVWYATLFYSVVQYRKVISNNRWNPGTRARKGKGNTITKTIRVESSSNKKYKS